VIEAGGPTLVSVNVAPEATPLTVAFTVYVPAVAFAVTASVAMPEAFVVALPVAALVDAPPAEGTAANDTLVPATGTPFASVTRAASGLAKAVPVEVSWLFPEYT
jgi:hypothetical protein